jgi:integrase
MAQTLKRLSAKTVQNAKAKGSIPRFLPDGGGLYLQISATGTKSWMFRFSINGRERQMGLGSLDAVDIIGARQVATECRRLRSQGVDPIVHRDTQRAEARLAAAASMTFNECAAALIESKKAGWKNAKHAAQWTSTLDTYAAPVIGDLPVQTVDTTLVLRVLEPIWPTKTETATRVRSRVEAVIDWATSRGYRKGENPARWRGHLENLLAKPSKVRKVKHHPALPYGELPAFMAALAEHGGVGARALEFTILAAARTSETLEARPTEFDMSDKIWIVPGERMKAEREHRVPLCERALSMLEEMRPLRAAENDFVFPGLKYRRPLSNMAMATVIRRMNKDRTAAGLARYVDPRLGGRDVVPHGFRSTFRDWAAECTDFPREVVEMALAHAVEDKVEAAYRRGDLFKKRQQLMDAWADYCAGRSSGVVVPFRAVV